MATMRALLCPEGGEIIMEEVTVHGVPRSGTLPQNSAQNHDYLEI